jgi:hypothetical protein
MPDNKQIREGNLQRMAQRMGFSLQKNRCRDPKIPSFGGYLLIDLESDLVAVGDSPFPYSASLDDIEEYLANRGNRAPA